MLRPQRVRLRLRFLGAHASGEQAVVDAYVDADHADLAVVEVGCQDGAGRALEAQA